MAAYYNEHDAQAAAWLRALIAAGAIADGEVDERDIQDVGAAVAETAAQEVMNYAVARGLRAEETMRMVQSTIGTEAVQRATGRQGSVSQEAVLFSFLQRVEAVLNRGSERGSCQKTRTEASGRVLRDLREYVSVECASLRRESEKQPDGQSADAVRYLSRFLARCSEACWSHACGEDASDISMNISRVGVLRGAGNAIVPQVAAEVIGAYLEIA